MDVLWILTGINTSAVLLWDLWGVISVPQLVSSPEEISDVHILFTKQCQRDDLLSAVSRCISQMMVSALNISKELKRGIGVSVC